ncbi:MAG: hypothetical protein DRQ49_13605 [Gammaproteobacteria bacterium]|nr:MAG: hypothetical protein DRQ49_13605 [Gammaproteobacteria bacterium]RKZ44152.1 MAG: hypothetical protein DRQ41_03495 [Gammaproteobacteria bacterium]RKZ75805.1 MAG: hypothetical protein DRQ57_06230 [Gammaproteobacteria bacterium]
MKKPRKKRFSDFNLEEALTLVGLNQLKKWSLDEVAPRRLSKLFQQLRHKLESHFDLSLSEAAKSMLIDAILLEAMDRFESIKIWKEANLQTDKTIGVVDYLIAPQGVVYQTPLLCVIEAKKDDFEKGLAQCLVEMEACRFRNKNLQPIDIYGIVTNSLTWRFYKFTVKNEIYESAPYAEPLEQTLGILRWILSQCVNNMKNVTD